MEKNWESYDKPNYKRMMAEKKMGPMEAKASIKKANYQEIEVDFETANAKGSWTLPLYAFTFYDSVGEEGGEVTLSVERDGEEYIYYGDMEGNSDNFDSEDEGCGCPTTKNAESLHRRHSHCVDCKCELNSKTHKMDTSASEGGAGGGHGALCDSCFVGGSKMRLDKNAEEPVVQEPDWIPDGDGRAIGQQDFAINLSPLHAEGMSNMNTDTVGNPSPTFNEDITGQDGPSSQPTNATFEAMNVFAPSSRDVDMARRDLKNSGYGDVVYDRYMVNRDGSSNKFYYTAVTEKDGKYYPMGSYGRIGYYSKLFNIMGKKESPRASTGSFEQAYRHAVQRNRLKSSETMWIIPSKWPKNSVLTKILCPTDKDTAYKNLAEKWKSP